MTSRTPTYHLLRRIGVDVQSANIEIHSTWRNADDRTLIDTATHLQGHVSEEEEEKEEEEEDDDDDDDDDDEVDTATRSNTDTGESGVYNADIPPSHAVGHRPAAHPTNSFLESLG